jgi:hypothetical protein
VYVQTISTITNYYFIIGGENGRIIKQYDLPEFEFMLKSIQNDQMMIMP